MSAYTDKFFADKAVGALWDVAVSIKRGNPLPLDKDSVVHGLTELNAIATGSVSYPGQIIAVIEDAVYEGEGEEQVLVKEESTTLYYLDHNKTPREVGKVPTGDGKTIQVSEAGAISLIGAATAANGTLPMLEEGALVWKTLEDIGAGDGNDNTTYAFAIENQKITITPSFNGVAQEAVELDLTSFITSDELTTALASYVTTEGLAGELTTLRGEMAAYVDTTELATALEPYAKTADVVAKSDYTTDMAGKVDTTTYATDKKALEDEDKAVRAIAEDAQSKIDTFLTSEEVDDVVNTLKEVKAEIDKMTDATELMEALSAKADVTTVEGIEDRVEVLEGKPFDTYATKSEVEAVDGKFANYTTTENLTTLLAGKQDTIAAGTYDAYGAAEAAETAAKGYADEKLALKANVADVYAKTEVYNQDEIDELLENIQAGSSESAASVKTQLDSYKKVINTELYGNEAGTGDSRIDALEAVGAQANVIEEVKASATAKLTATKEGKTVTIDDAALVALIAEAKKAGTDANSALETYKGTNDAAVEKVASDLAAEAGKVANLTTTVGEQGTKITNLETLTSGHTSTIESHTTSISGLTSGLATKAEQTALDAAIARIATNEGDIKTLKETTIPGINGEIAKKANSADVYTKTEIGTIEEGKTLVEMITAAGDTTALEARVKAVEDDYLKAADKTELAGLIDAVEEDVADHEGRIAEMENFWKAADDPEGAIDKLAEIVAYIESDKTGAIDMAADIQENAEAIAANAEDIAELGGKITALEEVDAEKNVITAIKVNGEALEVAEDRSVNLPIALANKLGVVKSSATGVKNVETGIWSGENKVAVLEDGTMEVNELNVNKLVQNDGDWLVLNGGTALI